MTLLLALLACGEDRSDTDLVDHLVRVSMAMRGVRPSVSDIEQVLRDPNALATLAREWTDDPRFGEMIRDMHAEQLLMRIDTRNHLPAVGPLTGTTPVQRIASLDEEPLRLIERLVITDRPYTEIVTSDLVMADPIAAIAFGLTIDPSNPEWQETAWTDGRPVAGILSSTALWQRHMSSDTNFHRARANVILSTLLCDPLQAAPVAGDPTDPDVATDPACASCHLRLDPLAASLWGFRRYVLADEVTDAYEAGCVDEWARDPLGLSSPFCYPIRMWDPTLVDDREALGLPPPAFEGPAPDRSVVPVADLADLGRQIADDPRFADCTARRFVGYLTQTPPLEVPSDQVDTLSDLLVASGWDAKALVQAIVLDPSFAPSGTVRPQLVRPEQLDRMIQDLTGWAWELDPGADYGPVRLATSDEYGYRTMLGGMDSWDTVVPDHHPMPTRELAMAWYAQEAAGFAVDSGRYPAGGFVTDPDDVEAALADLHLRILAEPEPDLGPSIALFESAFERSGDPVHAWKVVVTALLLDHRLVTY